MEHSHRASVCHPVSYTHLIIPPFSRDFGTKCPKAPALGCGKHFCENDGGRENIPTTPKVPRKSLVNAGIFRGYFSTRYLRLRRIYARFCSRRAVPVSYTHLVRLFLHFLLHTVHKAKKRLTLRPYTTNKMVQAESFFFGIKSYNIPVPSVPNEKANNINSE